MAIKDWKKIGEMYWVKDVNKINQTYSYISIEPLVSYGKKKKGKEVWYYGIPYDFDRKKGKIKYRIILDDKIIKTFKNESQALKYARDYMRNN